MKNQLLNINENFKVDWDKVEELETKIELEIIERYTTKMNLKYNY